MSKNIKMFNRDEFFNVVATASKDAMRDIIMPKYLELVKNEYGKTDIHPHEWKDSIIDAISINHVWYNAVDGSVHGDLKVDDKNESSFIRTLVIEEGNNHEGSLYTEPGKTSWDQTLSYQKVQDKKTKDGIPVVWVLNTNYPNAKKKIYRFSKRENRMKEYEATLSRFYPLFGRTNLPAKFNHEGQYVLKKSIDNARKMIERNGAEKANVKNYVNDEVKKDMNNIILNP